MGGQLRFLRVFLRILRDFAVHTPYAYCAPALLKIAFGPTRKTSHPKPEFPTPSHPIIRVRLRARLGSAPRRCMTRNPQIPINHKRLHDSLIKTDRHQTPRNHRLHIPNRPRNLRRNLIRRRISMQSREFPLNQISQRRRRFRVRTLQNHRPRQIRRSVNPHPIPFHLGPLRIRHIPQPQCPRRR